MSDDQDIRMRSTWIEGRALPATALALVENLLPSKERGVVFAFMRGVFDNGEVDVEDLYYSKDLNAFVLQLTFNPKPGEDSDGVCNRANEWMSANLDTPYFTTNMPTKKRKALMWQWQMLQMASWGL